MSDVDAGIPADTITDRRQKKITELLRSGRAADAVALLEPLTKVNPEDAALWRLLGVAQAAAGNLDGAVQCLQQAVTIDPNFAQSHLNLAVALKTSGDEALAREHARRALDLQPDYPQARDLLVALSQGTATPEPPPIIAPTPLGSTAAPALRGRTIDRDVAREQEIEREIEQGRERDREREREQAQYMLTMNQWCWSGFVCCLAGPPISLLWLFFNTGSPLALAAIFIPAIARYMILSVGMPILYALGALWLALVMYAGLRGNQLSWNRRSFPSVAAFHRSHRLWLYWGLGSIVVQFLSVYFLILPLIRTLIGR